nr:hypothetical protein KPHV_45960 [Kitasatospora purpeofusca]
MPTHSTATPSNGPRHAAPDRGRTEPLTELICGEDLIAEPGAGHRYINRGFILLGLALAHTRGRRLDELAADLWRSLGMTATAYGPLTRSARVAPTEQRLPGGPRLWGLPHDDNAALLGGVAGHAGVFTTPADLAAFATALPSSHANGGDVGRWLADSLQPLAGIEPGLDRGLAWILADEGRVAYHHGFTGTSLYLAPHTGRYLAICTNAVYHHQDNRTRLAPDHMEQVGDLLAERAAREADLGTVRLRQDGVDGALSSWNDFFDCADGIRSIKVQDAIHDMRAHLYRLLDVPGVEELDERASSLG